MDWDLNSAGQILFFVGAVLFSFYAIDTQAEIHEYRQDLKEEGCVAVQKPTESPQSLEMNTSTKLSSFNSSSFTTSDGT